MRLLDVMTVRKRTPLEWRVSPTREDDDAAEVEFLVKTLARTVTGSDGRHKPGSVGRAFALFTHTDKYLGRDTSTDVAELGATKWDLSPRALIPALEAWEEAMKIERLRRGRW